MGIKQISVGRSDLFQLRPHDIHVQEGFNARDFGKADAKEHVASLAAKIKAQGYDYSKPIKVKLIDGKAYVRDGECRLRAVRSLIDEGIEIRAVPVIAVKGTNDVDDLVEQVNANEGKRFDPFEEADLFKRLLSFGLSVDDIAIRIGKRPGYVTDRLTLGGADHDVRTLVRDGAIGVTAAREVVALPTERRREIVRTAKQAKAVGKKVTARQAKIASKGHADSISYRAVANLLDELRAKSEADPNHVALRYQIEGVELVLSLAANDVSLPN